MRNTNFIQDIEKALFIYQAWDFESNELLAQSHTLRSLIKILHSTGNMWPSVEGMVIIVDSGDGRDFQIPPDVYSKDSGYGRTILPIKSDPEHFLVDEDMKGDRDDRAELMSEQGFFRSQGYPEYDAFELAQKGQTFHEWMTIQAENEGKSLDDFYRQLFEGQAKRDDSVDVVIQRDEQNDYSIENIVDDRQRTIASVVRRQGQPEFRQNLIEAYEGKCAITECDAVAALEAAHIMSYRGIGTNKTSNGLLLRADVHTLFDLGLIAVDTATMTIILASELLDTTYAELADKPLRLPQRESSRPNIKALNEHRMQSKLFG